MINKQQLARFINKYYLNGTVESVVFNSDTRNQQLGTRFVSSDKSLLGEVKMDDWQYEDADIGVYDTEQLLRLLSVLDDKIEFSINKAGDKSISVKLSDALSSVNYILSDTSIINNGVSIGLENFGKSAPYKEIYNHFDITSDKVVQFARKLVRK